MKCEANPQGTNRRAVITNRPGVLILPNTAYDEHTDGTTHPNLNESCAQLRVCRACDCMSKFDSSAEDGPVVPEPSSLALLAVGAGG